MTRSELIERLSAVRAALVRDKKKNVSSLKRLESLIEDIELDGVLDVQQPPLLPKWLVYVPGKGHWAIKYDGNDKRVATRTYLKWAGLDRLPVDAFVSRVDEGKAQEQKRKAK